MFTRVMSLHHLSSSSWCPQAPWQSSGWSWTLLLAILPSTQRRGLARLQIHEHPQSETRTMSNSHFDLPVQFTHTKDQQNLVSSASSLLFFVFISLLVSVFPGFILTHLDKQTQTKFNQKEYFAKTNLPDSDWNLTSAWSSLEKTENSMSWFECTYTWGK